MPIEPQTVQALWEVSSRRLRLWFERKTGSAHDADDLVQETFLRVQARLAGLRDGERLGPWVAAIAANVLADHGRARGRRADPLDPALEGALEGALDAGAAACASPAEPATGGCEDEDLRAAVAGWIEAFLGRLDPEDAAILRAVDLAGRAQVDVARELGLSPSGARSRVQRARARLRGHLEDCCSFAFDVRGNLTDATRRPGSACDCDGA